MQKAAEEVKTLFAKVSNSQVFCKHQKAHRGMDKMVPAKVLLSYHLKPGAKSLCFLCERRERCLESIHTIIT